jgi:hypothetical protein
MKNKYTIASALLALGGAASMAHAAVTTTTDFASGDVLPNVSVSTSDLLQTSLASATGEPTGSPANFLRNGSTGTAQENTGTNPTVVTNAGSTLTYNLDITSNTFGYDISEILLFSGWQDARAGQSYIVSYSVVGDSGFTMLADVTQAASGGSFVTRTFDNTFSPLATGVDAVRFEIRNFGSLTDTVYREIDVIGAASVPEPSAALLGGLGVLALLRRRR